MKKLIKCVLIFILFTISTSIYSQVFDTTIAANLQFKIDSLKNTLNIKGISASAYYSNGGLWQGVTGDSYNGNPITTDMKFGIASNTKLFTAVSLLKLEEDNVLTLEDELNQWITPLDNVDSTIKIKELLNHSSGVFNFDDLVGINDSISENSNRIFTPTEVINWIEAPLFPAGTSTSYSNTNYLIAGLVIESASNQNIEPFMRSTLLTPNSLNDTFFPISETIIGEIAHPWVGGVDTNSIPRTSLNTIAWSAGAMYSTSKDMNDWYQKLFDLQIINTTSLNKMTTFQNGFGLGIAEYDINNISVYGHIGIIPGYSSIVIYDSLTEVIICVLINQDQAPVATVAQTLLLALISEPVVLNTSNNHVQDYGIELYPNPSNGIVNIDVPNGIFVKELNLYDLKGALLKTTTEKYLSIKNLANGIYILNVKTVENEINFKVVKTSF